MVSLMCVEIEEVLEIAQFTLTTRVRLVFVSISKCIESCPQVIAAISEIVSSQGLRRMRQGYRRISSFVFHYFSIVEGRHDPLRSDWLRGYKDVDILAIPYLLILDIE